MIKQKKTVIFTGDQLEKFIRNEGEHPDFPGWEFYADPEDGKYDSAKSSMVEYPLSMYNSNTKEKYKAIGGYYNEQCGQRFNDVEFELDRKVVHLHNGKFYANVLLNVDADTTDDEISIEEAKKITKSWILDLSKESMIVNINIETK